MGITAEQRQRYAQAYRDKLKAKKAPKTPHYLYLVELVTDRIKETIYKIGITKDYEQRFRQLKYDNKLAEVKPIIIARGEKAPIASTEFLFKSTYMNSLDRPSTIVLPQGHSEATRNIDTMIALKNYIKGKKGQLRGCKVKVFHE